MNIIEKLYYGEIESGKASEEQRDLIRLIERNEEKLVTDFTEKQKEIFKKFCDCYDELNEVGQREAFSHGFAMGAEIIIDVIRNSI